MVESYKIVIEAKSVFGEFLEGQTIPDSATNRWVKLCEQINTESQYIRKMDSGLVAIWTDCSALYLQYDKFEIYAFETLPQLVEFLITKLEQVKKSQS